LKAKSFMLIAGEASGDLLAAELVQALRREFAAEPTRPTNDYQPLHTSLEPRFFGAGGAQMAAAGVELAFDLTRHAVIGLGFLNTFLEIRRLFLQLVRLAREREPEAIICVDYAGFNRRFAHAIKSYVRRRHDWFHDWNPKIIQYVSPQVWASREGRAWQIARDYDLVVSTYPFEKEWYASRVPDLAVEYVGNPVVEKYLTVQSADRQPDGLPLIALLPGSRRAELARHLGPMLGALQIMSSSVPGLRARMVLPSDTLVQQARAFGLPSSLEIQCGGLPETLAQTTVAISKTGTVATECACAGVPTIAIYKTSWFTFEVGKRIVKVGHLAMPNLLAGEEVFPEFIQGAATAENIANAALALLRDEARRARTKARLREVMGTLGGSGASRRAARAIARLVGV
jgi:lipid-A-disaccharide synthase